MRKTRPGSPKLARKNQLQIETAFKHHSEEEIIKTKSGNYRHGQRQFFTIGARHEKLWTSYAEETKARKPADWSS